MPGVFPGFGILAFENWNTLSSLLDCYTWTGGTPKFDLYLPTLYISARCSCDHPRMDFRYFL